MKLLIALLITTAAWAGNACQTTGTGAFNWSNTAAWTNCGGTYPGGNAGDTALITRGPVTVDVSPANPIGLSLPPTPASATLPTVAVTGGGATGGLLQAGTYHLYVAYTSANGNVLMPAIQPTFTVSAGNIPRVTFPAAPAGATGSAIYLTAAGGAFGAETLYGSCIGGTPSGGVTACTGTTADLGGVQTTGSALPQYGAIYSTASIVVGSGVTLAVRGDIVIGDNLSLTLSGDSILEQDASLAPVPFSTSYRLAIGLNANATQTGNIFQTSGTSATHPAVWRGNAGGANPHFEAIRIDSSAGSLALMSNWNVSYMTFLRIGDASTTAFYVPNTRDGIFSHVIFDSCGAIAASSSAANSYSFTYVTWKNTLTTYALTTSASAAPNTGKLRQVSYCVFDKQSSLVTAYMSMDHNFFNNSFTVSGGGASWTNFANNVVRMTSSGGAQTSGPVSNSYALVDNWAGQITQDSGTATATSSTTITDTTKSWSLTDGLAGAGNPHWYSNASVSYVVVITSGAGIGQLRGINTNTSNTLTVQYPWTVTPSPGDGYEIYRLISNPQGFLLSSFTISVTGSICDVMGADEGTDCVYGTAPSGFQSTYNISTKNLGGGSSGNVGNFSTAAGAIIQHNTFYVRGAGSILTADVTSSTGQISNFTSNLAWSDDTSTVSNYKGIISNSRNVGTDTTVYASGGGYNACWNCITSSYGYDAGYNTKLSVAPTNDVIMSGSAASTGPNFVDPTRNFYTWAQSLGSTGTIKAIITDAQSKLMAQNDFGITAPTTLYTVDSLISWVKAGFAPTNSLLHGTASDGTDIGAVAYQAPAYVFPAAIERTKRVRR